MLIKINGNLGSLNGLPVQTHSISIEEKVSCLNIKINTTECGWLQLMLWDPAGKLRMQHLHLKKQSCITISEELNQNNCTTVSGYLPLGQYILEIFVDPRENIEYEIAVEDKSLDNINENIQIWTDGNYSSKGILLNKYDFTKRFSEENRWYSGDCHAHSTLSDGKQTMKESMASAEKMCLDFYFITEHNILPTAWYKGKVLAIPGVEVTGQPSHFNALGLNKWIDLRPNSIDGGISTQEGMNRLLEEVATNGAIRSVNHPALFPWRFEYKDTLLKNMDTIEIINDPTFKDSKLATEKALQLWNILWQNGHKIWGIGGSDSHLLPEEKYEGASKPSLIGDPKTWVYSKGLSAEGIITSIKQGRVYVSRGPELDIKIKCCGLEYLPGSDLSELFKENKELVLEYFIRFDYLEEECELKFVENGEEIICKKIIGGENYKFQLLWQGADYVWTRMELRNKEGHLLLFTNPVYKGEKKEKLTNWGELLEKAGGY